jgi:hypothetical protein
MHGWPATAASGSRRRCAGVKNRPWNEAGYPTFPRRPNHMYDEQEHPIEACACREQGQVSTVHGRTKIYRVRMSWCLESGSMVQTAVSHRDVAHAGGQPDTGSGNTGAKAWTKRSEKEVVDQVYCSTGTRGQMVQVEGKKKCSFFSK